MKFKKIIRPGMSAAKVVREKPRILRRNAEICPWCGAVESMHATRTKRVERQIYRYSVCVRCGKPVTRVITIA